MLVFLIAKVWFTFDLEYSWREWGLARGGAAFSPSHEAETSSMKHCHSPPPHKVKAIPMFVRALRSNIKGGAPNITTCSTSSSGTPWGGLQQSHTEPPSAPIKGEKAAPGTDLPPQKGERLPGSNCTLSAKRQGEAVYPHAREGPK